MKPSGRMLFVLGSWSTLLFACGGQTSAKPCTGDGDCSLGEVCSSEACIVGCRSDRDCPAERRTCDPTQGAAGACVQCLTERDCDAGQMCVTGTCRTTCARDADCPGQVCDLDNQVCVDCVESSDCPLGNVCEAQACIVGCERDRDCPQDLGVCDPDAGDHGTCFQCTLDAHCGDSQKCADNTCRDICTNHFQCPGGQCDPVLQTCVECVDKEACPLGEVCISNQCTAGCEEDRDCPSSTPACAPNDPPHGVCYECVDDNDCQTGTCSESHTCTGDPGGTGPVASFSVTPGSGLLATSFTADASATYDNDYPEAQLQVRWDWENDGVYDTSFTTTKTASKTYSTAGAKTIKLQVRNPADQRDTWTQTIGVFNGPPGTQGHACASQLQCANGYVCTAGGVCQEDCGTPGGTCTTAGTTCGFGFSIDGTLAFVCQ